jgi:hypothetical protein
MNVDVGEDRNPCKLALRSDIKTFAGGGKLTGRYNAGA